MTKRVSLQKTKTDNTYHKPNNKADPLCRTFFQGWCNVFDHYVFRHHPCTNTCSRAIQPLLESQPVTVKVELVSKELDPDEDTPVHQDCFVVEVTVNKPDRQKVESAIAYLGYTSEYDITYYWIPEKFVASDLI